eukprot:PITA_11361
MIFNQSSILNCITLIAILCICGRAPHCLATKAVGEAAATNISSPTSAAEKDGLGAVQMVEKKIINSTRRELTFFSPATGNPIDDCWMGDPNWRRNRKRLADCGVGFGKDAIGGREGRIYVVRDPGDDPMNPWRGTLRYGVIQERPLWIIFKNDMVIQLKEELVMNSFKTLDGRGVNVHITNGPCITVENVSNIIIHGIHIHNCKPPNRVGNAPVRDSPTHYAFRWVADGDGISIIASTHIWIDHCSLSKCRDGLIDAVSGSTAITISNNYFTDHDEVMLLGNDDNNIQDKTMQVTIAYNHFGEGLGQRMPRCRLGHSHVVNNDYIHWQMYAIGGSANPTILSEGNRFLASANPYTKEVTRRLAVNANEGLEWNWISKNDVLLDGAFFKQSGLFTQTLSAQSLKPMPGTLVGVITRNAGVLRCGRGRQSRC